MKRIPCISVTYVNMVSKLSTVLGKDIIFTSRFFVMHYVKQRYIKFLKINILPEILSQ